MKIPCGGYGIKLKICLLLLLNIFVLFLGTKIRLIGGNSRFEGRIEIMYQGLWGTICDDGWDDNDTAVVCRQLGLFNGTVTMQNQFGSSSGPIWLHQVNCSGNESILSHCMHYGAGNTGNCSHDNDVAVRCSPFGMYIAMYM